MSGTQKLTLCRILTFPRTHSVWMPTLISASRTVCVGGRSSVERSCTQEGLRFLRVSSTRAHGFLTPRCVCSQYAREREVRAKARGEIEYAKRKGSTPRGRKLDFGSRNLNPVCRELRPWHEDPRFAQTPKRPELNNRDTLEKKFPRAKPCKSSRKNRSRSRLLRCRLGRERRGPSWRLFQPGSARSQRSAKVSPPSELLLRRRGAGVVVCTCVAWSLSRGPL